MEIKKIRYMSVEEQKKFKTDKKFVVVELQDKSLLFSEKVYYYDKEEDKLQLIE
jgi:hypothetical protein